MRISLYVSIFLSATTCFAQWQGFPLSTNPETDWNILNDSYHPISQLYSATVERATFSGVTLPNIVETWSWYSGTNISTTNETIITTNIVDSITNIYTNIYVYTNLFHLSTNVTTTNVIAPTIYTYTDMSGSHSGTGYPYVTRYFMSQLDTTIEACIPKFVATNYAVGGNFNNWFTNNTDFPIENKPQMFMDYGVGFVTNLTGNPAAATNQYTAYWTKQVASSNGWLLSEAHYSTNGTGWNFVDQDTFDTNYYSPVGIFPGVLYTSSSTNYDNLPITLTITGTVLNITNQIPFAASETVVVNASNTPLTKYWYDITSMTSANSVSNGDVLAVVWTNNIVLYGAWAYEMDSVAIDERWTILNGLQWTRVAPGALSVTPISYIPTAYISNTFTNTSFVLAKADMAAWLNISTNWTLGNPGVSSHQMAIRQYFLGGSTYVAEFPFISGATPSAKWAAKGTHIPASIQHSADVYISASASSSYFDFTGLHPTADRFSYATTFTESFDTNAIYTNFWVNPAENFPSAVDNAQGRQSLSSPGGAFLLKWDGANGFIWK